MKKHILAFLLAAILVLFIVSTSRTLAQTATPTGPSNDVQGFFVVCADSAVINFTGSMLAGFDIYFQLFAGNDGSGYGTDRTPAGAGQRRIQLQRAGAL